MIFALQYIVLLLSGAFHIATCSETEANRSRYDDLIKALIDQYNILANRSHVLTLDDLRGRELDKEPVKLANRYLVQFEGVETYSKPQYYSYRKLNVYYLFKIADLADPNNSEALPYLLKLGYQCTVPSFSIRVRTGSLSYSLRKSKFISSNTVKEILKFSSRGEIICNL